MSKTEYLCGLCYTDGVDKELFVAMTKFFMDNALTPLDLPDEIRQHIDFLTEREGMISVLPRDERPRWAEADRESWRTPDLEDVNEKKMIAEMKQEYLMYDCPSWRRLEIQQDLSTYNELVPNLPFRDDE